MKGSLVRFALSAASPLSALRFECASLSDRKSKDLLSEGLRPLVFGGGRILNRKVEVL